MNFLFNAFQKMPGGMVNELWKVWHKNGKDDAIVVRIFGPNSGLFDRNKEKHLMETLHKQKISAPLYAR